MEEQYKPFGREWELGFMRLTKKQMMEQFKKLAILHKELKNEQNE